MADVGEKKGVLKAMSALLNRMQFAARAGLQFGGARDLWKVFGYKSLPLYQDFLARYCRQDIAKRIVDAPPAATWAYPPVFEDVPADFQKAWDAISDEIPIWHYLNRVDSLAGIGRFSVMLIGLDDGAPLDQPVRKGKASKILYLQPYGEGSVNITQYVTDVRDPRYALPMTYALNQVDPNMPATSVVARPVGTLMVHASRILHVAEGVLENDIFGIPRMQNCYNLLDDLQKVVGGSAEMYWLNARGGMQLDVDKDMAFTEEDAAALSDEIDEFTHQLRRTVRTRGVSMKALDSKSPAPQQTFGMLISLISGTTGIPNRILIGSEAGQLASNQDRANWAERVTERRAQFAEPKILIPFIRLLQNAGVLPAATKITCRWPPAFQMSPLEKSQTSAQLARSVINMQRIFSDAVKGTQASVPQMINAPPGTQAPADPNADPSVTANAFPPAGGDAGAGGGGFAPPVQVPAPDPTVVIEPIITREECRQILEMGMGETFADLASKSGASQ